MHRVKQVLWLAGLISFFLALPARAQYDYSLSFRTNTITGGFSNWFGAYIVGSNTFRNALLIQNAGTLADDLGWIGLETGASNNVVSVTGAGSVWTNRFDIHLGVKGAGNQLIVTNGAKVINLAGYVGEAGSNNTALVAAAVWSNSFGLSVGLTGTNNALIVSNSASVFDLTGVVGANTSAWNNAVSVTGTGALWSSSGNLLIGSDGSGSRLAVTNAGHVLNNEGFIGNNASSRSNIVAVTGTGSVWSNMSNLSVGSSGWGNQLQISAGGGVVNNDGYIGYNASSSNNSVIVNGGSWSNTLGVTVGIFGPRNSLTISNGGLVVNFAGNLGFNEPSISNLVVVTGTSSVWSNASNLSVGLSGSGNRLQISAGGGVVNNDGYIGYNASGSNNSAVVNGGSWSNTVGMTIGVFGSRNSLTISNGGVVVNFAGNLGFDVLSVSNVAVVTGSSSIWSNRSDFSVGLAGVGNTLIITNGGTVFNNTGAIGFYASASNNTAIVSSGTWNNASSLYIGKDAAASSLKIVNGGKVVCNEGIIGNSSSSNLVVVTGAGATWNVQSNLSVGASGISNSMVVAAGGKVFNSLAFIGRNSTAFSNSVLVTGTGSVWSNADLYVGEAGSGNSLTISNGGCVLNANAYLGVFPSNGKDMVTVTGAGSVWTNMSPGIVVVGDGSHGCLLTIANGGMVVDVDAWVGYSTGGAGNTGLVSGASSVWTNRGNLVVGNGADRNGLLINGGARVFDNNGIIGFGASQNSVVVDGAGSVWVNNSALTIGQSGTLNSLTISNGGQVVCNTGYVGSNGNVNANSVLVTGPGSTWTNTADLNVGYLGTGNLLVVSNFASVVNGNSYIGAYSNDNRVVVADNGRWETRGLLNVGLVGNSNALTIAGGTVVADNLWIGFFGNSVIMLWSADEVVRVDSGNLYVTNAAGNAGIYLGNLLFKSELILNGGSVTCDNLLCTNSASSVVTFSAGTLSTRACSLTYTQQFIIGDSVRAATYRMLGSSTHSFQGGLRVRNNATLTGCGLLAGILVIDAGGTVGSDCGLIISGNVTNNGSILPLAGGNLDFFGNVVNNGTIDNIFGNVNFHAGLVNTGTIITSNDVRIVDISRSGNNMVVKAQSFTSHTFQLQSRHSMVAGGWSDIGTNQIGTGGSLTFTDTGGATNIPTHFYRVRVSP